MASIAFWPSPRAESECANQGDKRGRGITRSRSAGLGPVDRTNKVSLFFALILGTTDLFEQHPFTVAWHKLMLAAVLVIAGEAAAVTVEFPLGRRIVLQLAGYVSGLALVLLWHPVQA